MKKTLTSDATEKKSRVRHILKNLAPLYHADPIEVNYTTPFQLIVAVILSAQCTDKRVNQVTATFFNRLKTPEDFLREGELRLSELIRSTGFFRNKAKNIVGAARMILDEYDGKVPDSMAELVEIPGFGRKTANVVQQALYGTSEGVCVDTHVLRLSKRLGLTLQTTAEKVECDLMEITPQKNWRELSHFLILHGRRVCVARGPRCEECVLRPVCPYKAE